MSVKDDITKNKKCLYEVFFAIKELVTAKITDDLCGFIDWNKIWLNCTEYDLTEKHSYHFEKLYLAVDGVICIMDPFLKNYKLGCEMIHGCVYLCENVILFCFSMENNEHDVNSLRKTLRLNLNIHDNRKCEYCDWSKNCCEWCGKKKL